VKALVRQVTIKPGAVVGQDMRWLKWFDAEMIFTAHPFTEGKWKLTATGYGLFTGRPETYGNGALYVGESDLLDVPPGSKKYDHDEVRCDEMAAADHASKVVGEARTCCVCAGHACEAARAKRSNMTDTERIDALERLLWSDSIGNGIVIFPCTEHQTGRRLVSLTDLGDEDGSNLGEELTETVPTLREAIDLAVSANAAALEVGK
jgi:hypothetical protein